MEVEVPRTRSWVRLHKRLRGGGQFSGRLVEFVNVDPVGSEIAEKEEITGWIGLGHVRVRRVVAAIGEAIGWTIRGVMRPQRAGGDILHVVSVAKRSVRLYRHDGHAS